MPILSIIQQPAPAETVAAYRPIILRVVAQSTDGTPVPPVVYCDVYIDGKYIKSYEKTQYASLGSGNSEWEFNIMRTCQELLEKSIPANGSPNITSALGTVKRVFCRFAASGINGDGFIERELYGGLAPVQGTSANPSVPGTGIQTNDFYVLNATILHEKNQSLLSRLNFIKKGVWDALVWPLSERPNLEAVSRDANNFFPILHGDQITFKCLRLNYKKRGSNGYTQEQNCSPGTCTLVISNLFVEAVLLGSSYSYHATWVLAGSPPALGYTIEVSTDNGVTWTGPDAGNNDGPNSFYYAVGDASTPVNHVMRLSGLCSIGSSSSTFTTYFSSDYEVSITILNITANSFEIDAVFAVGVTYDLSLDGGSTWTTLGISDTPHLVDGLASGATYRVVRRMNDLNGNAQVIPFVTTVTTL